MGTAKLVENISHHVKDDHPHDLAFDDDDSAPTVSGNTPRVLKNVSSKLPYEVTELSKDLNLK